MTKINSIKLVQKLQKSLKNKNSEKKFKEIPQKQLEKLTN